MSYFAKAGTVLSQAANALVCNGHPDMSLSTRAYLEQDSSLFWRAIHALAEIAFGSGHCQEAWESDCRFADDIHRIAENR